MREELDKALVERYPPLYRDQNGDMQKTCMCWGFECGDGWFDILDALSASICEDWLQAKYEFDKLYKRLGKPIYGDSGEVVSAGMLEQARVKMESAADAVPSAVQVKEKFGTLRFYLSGCNDKVDSLVSFAERMSEVTCENCGDKGALTRGGWIRCLCDKCREKSGIMSIADEKAAMSGVGGV